VSGRPRFDFSELGCSGIIVVLIICLFASFTIVSVADAIASCFGGRAQ
jgi:hypothetical protein